MDPDDLPKTNQWDEYRRLVIAELERIDRSLGQINVKMDMTTEVRNKEISSLRVEIAILKVKASIFGAACGLAASAIVPIVKLIASAG
jgi:hypothetical protein